MFPFAPLSTIQRWSGPGTVLEDRRDFILLDGGSGVLSAGRWRCCASWCSQQRLTGSSQICTAATAANELHTLVMLAHAALFEQKAGHH